MASIQVLCITQSVSRSLCLVSGDVFLSQSEGSSSSTSISSSCPPKAKATHRKETGSRRDEGRVWTLSYSQKEIIYHESTVLPFHPKSHNVSNREHASKGLA